MQNNDTPRPPLVKMTRWLQVPEEINEHPDLTGNDIRVAGALIKWLKNGVSCWVCNSELTKITKLKERALQYSFRRLEKTGWFRFVTNEDNKTHREVIAVWREGYAPWCGGAPHDRAGVAPHGGAGELYELTPDSRNLIPEVAVDPCNHTAVCADLQTTLIANENGHTRPADSDLIDRLRKAVPRLASLKGKEAVREVNRIEPMLCKVTGDSREWRPLRYGMLWLVVKGIATPEQLLDSVDVLTANLKSREPCDVAPAYFRGILRNKVLGLTDEDLEEAFREVEAMGQDLLPEE